MKPQQRTLSILMPAILMLGAQGAPQAQTAPPPAIEVVHYWTSGGEKEAVQALRKAFEARGGVWKDRPTANNDASRKLVLNRIVAGYPPAAMQWHATSELRDMVDIGAVGDIDAVATRQDWRAVMPPLVVARSSFGGRFYLAPVGMHAENWLWSNRSVYRAAGVAVPARWDEFLKIAPLLERRGVVPLAVGDGDWEVALLFDSILFGEVGKDAYRRFLAGDASVITSAGGIRSLATFGQLRAHVGRPVAGRSWSQATAEVIAGRAASQVMGDWAKAEFIRAGMTPGKEFQCTLAPGTAGSYHFVIDGFAFPPSGSPQRAHWQQLLAETMLDPEVQLRFNKAKGSIPVRRDVDTSRLDSCAQLGMKIAAQADNLVVPPSMQMQFNLRAGVLAILGGYWRTPGASPEQTARTIAELFQQMNVMSIQAKS
jgi:glucose/mannose transport system substrate-binding protein